MNKKVSDNDSISRPDTMKASVAIPAAVEQKAAEPDTAGGISPDSMIAMTGKDCITDWKEFWLKMKRAIAEKDTSALIRGTYFPFFQNSSLFYVRNFKEVTLIQLFDTDMKRVKGPDFVGDYDFSGSNDETNTSAEVHGDSSFILSISHQQLYFGKVKGCYMLLGMNTPG